MLSIRALRKSYGGFEAVRGVSLEVADGEFVTLLGPSGCGKTTTLRCIAGLEDPDGGEIWLGGEQVSAPERSINVLPEKRRIGMVFQSYALWPHMTVLENVAYPLLRQKIAAKARDQRAQAALELVGLSQYSKSSPGQLSGGQQQRVALARALASECRILLFDEPLSNLDVRLREQLRTEIRDLQQRVGLTAVYVTHDQSEALAISDRIVVMNQGLIVQMGTPREVYERPNSVFAANFLGGVNLIPVSVVGANGDERRVRTSDGKDIRVPHSSHLQGDKLKLGLRSELMSLVATGAPASTDNEWQGTVTRAIFLGDSTEYLLDAAGTQLKARVPPNVRFAAGDKVLVRISSRDCFLIEEA